jgi:hypothetical protein
VPGPIDREQAGEQCAPSDAEARFDCQVNAKPWNRLDCWRYILTNTSRGSVAHARLAENEKPECVCPRTRSNGARARQIFFNNIEQCDGSRPTCKACEQRRVECRYDVEEGITRTAALKSKLEQLELDYGSIVDLHSQLKHGQPDEVAALVNRIRAEDPLESRAPLNPGCITSETHSHADEMASSDMASEANWESFNKPLAAFGEIPRNPFPSNSLYRRMPDNIPIDPALAGLDPQLSPYNQPSASNPGSQSLAIPMPFNQDPSLNIYNMSMSNFDAPISARYLYQTQTPSMLRSNISNVRQGMAIQSRSMPEVCTAYSESEVEGLILAIEMQPDHDIPRASLCELSSIAAVAAQYVRGHLQPGVIEFFYGESIE